MIRLFLPKMRLPPSVMLSLSLEPPEQFWKTRLDKAASATKTTNCPRRQFHESGPYSCCCEYWKGRLTMSTIVPRKGGVESGPGSCLRLALRRRRSSRAKEATAPTDASATSFTLTERTRSTSVSFAVRTKSERLVIGAEAVRCGKEPLPS
eukprot:02753_4